MLHKIITRLSSLSDVIPHKNGSFSILSCFVILTGKVRSVSRLFTKTEG